MQRAVLIIRNDSMESLLLLGTFSSEIIHSKGYFAKEMIYSKKKSCLFVLLLLFSFWTRESSEVKFSKLMTW